MVTGDEWREAVALATDRPGLSVGLHLVLVRAASVASQPFACACWYSSVPG